VISFMKQPSWLHTNFHTYTHYFGGNGLLFKDEVWYGVRDNDQTDSSSAEPNIFVGIVYSGGVNA